MTANRKTHHTAMSDFTFYDLVKAYMSCRRRKRGTFHAVAFEFELEKNLFQLYEDLKSGNYQIGNSICFVILKPKPREVWAASFRDRIVHHLVYNAIYQRFFNTFITDSYSCIPKRGSLNAARKLCRYVQAITNNYSSPAYYLKADIKNFFVSIDKNILFNLLKSKVKEKWILDLLYKIIFDNPREHVIVKSSPKRFDQLPKHKSLWYADTKFGLPIGNLTSQFFSNIYLNVLDQFIKRELKCKYYCRYVDDFVILDKSPQKLNEYHKSISDFLQKNLALELHNDKKIISRTYLGIDFVGYIVKHNRMYLRQKTMRRIYKLFYSISNLAYGRRFITILHAMNSYFGFLRAVKGFTYRKKLSSFVIPSLIDTDKNCQKLFLPSQFLIK